MNVLKIKTLAEYNLGTSVISSGNTTVFDTNSPIGTQSGSALITMLGGNTGTAYKEHFFYKSRDGKTFLRIRR